MTSRAEPVAEVNGDVVVGGRMGAGGGGSLDFEVIVAVSSVRTNLSRWQEHLADDEQTLFLLTTTNNKSLPT